MPSNYRFTPAIHVSPTILRPQLRRQDRAYPRCRRKLPGPDGKAQANDVEISHAQKASDCERYTSDQKKILSSRIEELQRKMTLLNASSQDQKRCELRRITAQSAEEKRCTSDILFAFR
ncbi:hypothetical protein VTL71DRAFT_6759 [Oculimacula yallundae]|uniref:Uncharacterized protein n=1 Tax=Oculimacula yallundae TaxID=86028 RepID=A0ABR4BXY7_9HELO